MTAWSKWEWHTGPVMYADCCHQCFQPLRSHAGAGIVSWRDGHLYAVGCLLNRLAAAPPVASWDSNGSAVD